MQAPEGQDSSYTDVNAVLVEGSQGQGSSNMTTTAQALGATGNEEVTVPQVSPTDLESQVQGKSKARRVYMGAVGYTQSLGCNAIIVHRPAGKWGKQRPRVSLPYADSTTDESVEEIAFRALVSVCDRGVSTSVVRKRAREYLQTAASWELIQVLRGNSEHVVVLSDAHMIVPSYFSRAQLVRTRDLESRELLTTDGQRVQWDHVLSLSALEALMRAGQGGVAPAPAPAAGTSTAACSGEASSEPRRGRSIERDAESSRQRAQAPAPRQLHEAGASRGVSEPLSRTLPTLDEACAATDPSVAPSRAPTHAPTMEAELDAHVDVVHLPTEEFVDIADGTCGATRYVATDENFVTFHDRGKGPFQIHLLTIPRVRIRDVSQLTTADHAEIVRGMVRQAHAAVASLGLSEFVEADACMGFHAHDRVSIRWLHLHTLWPYSPATAPSRYREPIFLTPLNVLSRLPAANPFVPIGEEGAAAPGAETLTVSRTDIMQRMCEVLSAPELVASYGEGAVGILFERYQEHPHLWISEAGASFVEQVHRAVARMRELQAAAEAQRHGEESQPASDTLSLLAENARLPALSSAHTRASMSGATETRQQLGTEPHSAYAVEEEPEHGDRESGLSPLRVCPVEESAEPRACAYCGNTLQDSLVVGLVSSRAYCNVFRPHLRASCAIAHLRYFNEAIRFHSGSQRGAAAVECAATGEANAFALCVVIGPSTSALMVPHRVPSERGALGELVSASEQVEQLVTKSLCLHAGIVHTEACGAAAPVAAWEVAQLEERWVESAEATMADVRAAQQRAPRLPARYADAWHVQRMWMPIVASEALAHRRLRQRMQQPNTFVTWASHVDLQLRAHFSLERKADVGLLSISDPCTLKTRQWECFGTVTSVKENGSVCVRITKPTNFSAGSDYHTDVTVTFSPSVSLFQRQQMTLRIMRRVQTACTPPIMAALCGHVEDLGALPAFSAIAPAGELEAIVQELNQQQRKAVMRALQAALTLVRGPPGTGKTSVAAAIVRAALACGLGRVLCAAQSNAAIGELYHRLKAQRVSVYCIPTQRGNVTAYDGLMHLAGLHMRDAKPSELVWIEKLRDLEQLSTRTKGNMPEQRAHELRTLRKTATAFVRRYADVICCTLATAAGARCIAAHFPFTLLDEAAQSTEVETLQAVIHGSRQLVMVGDDKQLGATTLSENARVAGARISWFQRLLHLGVEPVVLHVQHRMHPRLIEYPSKTFYGGAVCSPTGRAFAQSREHGLQGFPWPTESAIAFFECKGEMTYASDGTSRQNAREATAAIRVAAELLRCGADEVTLLSAYKAQVEYMRGRTQGMFGVQVSSIDGVQGRESEFIVLSCVRRGVGKLGALDDAQRLNVALTRQRRGLVLVGDSESLQHGEVLGPYMKELRAAGQIVAWPTEWAPAETLSPPPSPPSRCDVRDLGSTALSVSGGGTPPHRICSSVWQYVSSKVTVSLNAIRLAFANGTGYQPPLSPPPSPPPQLPSVAEWEAEWAQYDSSSHVRTAIVWLMAAEHPACICVVDGCAPLIFTRQRELKSATAFEEWVKKKVACKLSHGHSCVDWRLVCDGLKSRAPLTPMLVFSARVSGRMPALVPQRAAAGCEAMRVVDVLGTRATAMRSMPWRVCQASLYEVWRHSAGPRELLAAIELWANGDVRAYGTANDEFNIVPVLAGVPLETEPRALWVPLTLVAPPTVQRPHSQARAAPASFEEQLKAYVRAAHLSGLTDGVAAEVEELSTKGDTRHVVAEPDTRMQSQIDQLGLVIWRGTDIVTYAIDTRRLGIFMARGRRWTAEDERGIADPQQRSEDREAHVRQMAAALSDALVGHLAGRSCFAAARELLEDAIRKHPRGERCLVDYVGAATSDGRGTASTGMSIRVVTALWSVQLGVDASLNEKQSTSGLCGLRMPFVDARSGKQHMCMTTSRGAAASPDGQPVSRHFRLKDVAEAAQWVPGSGQLRPLQLYYCEESLLLQHLIGSWRGNVAEMIRQLGEHRRGEEDIARSAECALAVSIGANGGEPCFARDWLHLPECRNALKRGLQLDMSKVPMPSARASGEPHTSLAVPADVDAALSVTLLESLGALARGLPVKFEGNGVCVAFILSLQVISCRHGQRAIACEAAGTNNRLRRAFAQAEECAQDFAMAPWAPLSFEAGFHIQLTQGKCRDTRRLYPFMSATARETLNLESGSMLACTHQNGMTIPRRILGVSWHSSFLACARAYEGEVLLDSRRMSDNAIRRAFYALYAKHQPDFAVWCNEQSDDSKGIVCFHLAAPQLDSVFPWEPVARSRTRAGNEVVEKVALPSEVQCL